MKNQIKTNRCPQIFTALALLITMIVATWFMLDDRNPAPAAASSRTTPATAEQDKRMVMQELERERFDQMNATQVTAQARAQNAAEQDRRMVMQEQESEQLDQLNSNRLGGSRSFDAASIACYELRPSCDR